MGYKIHPYSIFKTGEYMCVGGSGGQRGKVFKYTDLELRGTIRVFHKAGPNPNEGKYFQLW